jgi:hypothetical protein
MKPHLKFIANGWYCDGGGIGTFAPTVNESLELWKRCIRIAQGMNNPSRTECGDN